jgi:hypothetical protein
MAAAGPRRAVGSEPRETAALRTTATTTMLAARSSPAWKPSLRAVACATSPAEHGGGIACDRGARPRGGELDDGLALVGGEAFDVDESPHVEVSGGGVGDHGAAVAVPDEHDRRRSMIGRVMGTPDVHMVLTSPPSIT